MNVRGNENRCGISYQNIRFFGTQVAQCSSLSSRPSLSLVKAQHGVKKPGSVNISRNIEQSSQRPAVIDLHVSRVAVNIRGTEINPSGNALVYAIVDPYSNISFQYSITFRHIFSLSSQSLNLSSNSHATHMISFQKCFSISPS